MPTHLPNKGEIMKRVHFFKKNPFIGQPTCPIEGKNEKGVKMINKINLIKI